jgi:hypothetical protein
MTVYSGNNCYFLQLAKLKGKFEFSLELTIILSSETLSWPEQAAMAG